MFEDNPDVKDKFYEFRDYTIEDLKKPEQQMGKKTFQDVKNRFLNQSIDPNLNILFNLKWRIRFVIKNNWHPLTVANCFSKYCVINW